MDRNDLFDRKCQNFFGVVLAYLQGFFVSRDKFLDPAEPLTTFFIFNLDYAIVALGNTTMRMHVNNFTVLESILHRIANDVNGIRTRNIEKNRRSQNISHLVMAVKN